jgi:hypothetical protein
MQASRAKEAAEADARLGDGPLEHADPTFWDLQQSVQQAAIGRRQARRAAASLDSGPMQSWKAYVGEFDLGSPASALGSAALDALPRQQQQPQQQQEQEPHLTLPGARKPVKPTRWTAEVRQCSTLLSMLRADCCPNPYARINGCSGRSAALDTNAVTATPNSQRKSTPCSSALHRLCCLSAGDRAPPRPDPRLWREPLEKDAG